MVKFRPLKEQDRTSARYQGAPPFGGVLACRRTVSYFGGVECCGVMPLTCFLISWNAIIYNTTRSIPQPFKDLTSLGSTMVTGQKIRKSLDSPSDCSKNQIFNLATTQSVNHRILFRHHSLSRYRQVSETGATDAVHDVPACRGHHIHQYRYAHCGLFSTPGFHLDFFFFHACI